MEFTHNVMEDLIGNFDLKYRDMFKDEINTIYQALNQIHVIPDEKPIHVDPILIKVYNKYQERSNAGIKKYGNKLENNSLPLKDWLKYDLLVTGSSDS